MGWDGPGLGLSNPVPKIRLACRGLSNPGPKLNGPTTNLVCTSPGWDRAGPELSQIFDISKTLSNYSYYHQTPGVNQTFNPM